MMAMLAGKLGRKRELDAEERFGTHDSAPLTTRITQMYFKNNLRRFDCSHQKIVHFH